MNKCYAAVENKIGGVFAAYGRFVARHPWKIVFIGIVINGLLGIGILRLNYVIDVQTVYTPINSQASNDSDRVREIFPDLSGTNFRPLQMPDLGRHGEVIVRPNQGNILDVNFLNDLKLLYSFLINLSTTDENGHNVNLTEICARAGSACAIDGDYFTDHEFISAVSTNTVTYPFFFHSVRGPLYYAQIVGGTNASDTHLVSATMLILRVNLRTDSAYYQNTAKNWQKSFLEEIQSYKSDRFEITFSHSDSQSEELDKNVSADITFFTITFTLMITYAFMATMTARCDCVGQRSNLGFGGVLAAGLAILSAFGLVSLCGVDFVSIVGVVPFLIIGKTLDTYEFSAKYIVLLLE